MVTFKVFVCSVSFLILHFSGSLYAQEPPLNPSTPSTNCRQATSTSNTSLVTDTPDISQNDTNSIPTIPSHLPSDNHPLNMTQINDTQSSPIDKSNSDLNSEFPQTSGNGKKIYYANRTLETPILNATVTNNNTLVEPPQKTNGTKIKCPTDMTIDVSNSTETEKKNNANLIDTEVPDLLNNPAVKTYNVSPISVTPPNNTLNISHVINSDTELIEDGQNTEEILRVPSKHEEGAANPGVPLIQGQLAAILAGVFVVVSVIAYFGLLSWRRYLENRYGNRQMLINEDEFNDADDIRRFTI